MDVPRSCRRICDIMALEHVWQPGAIGPLQLPHRLVMGSMHLGLEAVDPDGSMLAAFYAERAAGGAGLIVTGGSAVSRVGAGGVSYSFINEDADAEKLAAIPAAVHAEGGLVLLQLFHAGRYAFEKSFGLQPVAPSAVYSTYSRCEPRALTEEEIVATIDDFASGARRARELGFDGVEIMGSEGYLLSQFMAPVTNLREDDWGGDAERRMRFPLAVAAAVREAAGPGCAVVYRLSGADLVPGGASVDEVIALASRLASGPADALNVGIGWHESRVPTRAVGGAARGLGAVGAGGAGGRGRAGDRVEPGQHGGAGRRADRGRLCRLRVDGAAVPGRSAVRAHEPRRAGAAGERVHRLQPVHRPVDLRPAGVVRREPAGRLRARADGGRRRGAGGGRRRWAGGDGGGAGAGGRGLRRVAVRGG